MPKNDSAKRFSLTLPLHFIANSFKDGIPRRSCLRGKEVEESGTKARRGSRAVEGRQVEKLRDSAEPSRLRSR
jgi:hypothetical protein